MKSLFLVVSLAAALIALPALAQQGPAGVPGAPGLAPPPPVIAAPPALASPLVAQASQPKRQAAKCSKAQAGKHGCPPKKVKPANCSASADLARCERYRKARELCQDLLDPEYRQCLRDTLTPPK